MLQDTLHVAVDTVKAVVDTVKAVADTVAAPSPATGAELILYWVTLAAGFVSGYAVKALAKLTTLVGKLGEPLKLAIIAGLSFLGVKLAVFFGLTLPENPLAWDPTMVNTVLSTVFGYAVSKTALVKTPPTTPPESPKE